MNNRATIIIRGFKGPGEEEIVSFHYLADAGVANGEDDDDEEGDCSMAAQIV
jgi:hypothetical protein